VVQFVWAFAAAFTAAALIVGSVDCAFAQSEANGEHVDHAILFGGFDLWRNAAFMHGGMLWSPDGLEHEGFSLKVLFNGGSYNYLSGPSEITGTQLLANVMPGWRFKGDHYEAMIFGGIDLQSDTFVPDDPGNRLHGITAGLRVGGDIWYQPNDWLMATAAASASTVGASFWSRAALGWRLRDWAWVGPEVAALGDHDYQQLRLGIHFTAFKTGRFEWSAGFGEVWDTDNRSGVYGRIGLLTRR
jgi:hypothetical protein